MGAATLIGFIRAESDRKLMQIFNFNNYYWLTNRHAIIMTKQAASDDYTTTVIDLAATDAVKMIERGDGSGSIVFGRSAVNTYSPATRGYVSNEADYSFSDVPNVVEVYRMVQEVQRAARGRV